MKELKIEALNKIALVEDYDFEKCSKVKWWSNGNTVYTIVYRGYGLTHKYIQLANFILQIEGMIDHKDRNSFNFSRNNLRKCSRSQNAANTTKRKQKTSSKYKGVGWSKLMNRRRSRIMKNWKEIGLGYFDTEIEAAIAYDDKALEIYGEFAVLNFPLYGA